MPPPDPPPSSDSTLAERIARLEERITRLEAMQPGSAPEKPEPLPRPQIAALPTRPVPTDDEFEYEVGQNWFARVGILVLAGGGVYLLAQPYATLPTILPALAGYVMAAALFIIAHRWQKSFELVANYLRGAAMALTWFATLRLSFFGASPALAPSSPLLVLLLGIAVAVNIGLAYHRRSPRLATLALAMGYASALALGSATDVLATIVILAVVVAATASRMNWTAPLFAAAVLGSATYLVWAAGNPVRGGYFQFVNAPVSAPGFLLAAVVALALGAWHRLRGGGDALTAATAAALNCGFGYAVFLLHTAAGFPGSFAISHLVASIVFLGLAVVFWYDHECRASTFFYAMTGYAALSVAIIKTTAVPNVFVWLSAESLVVVATAVWFRSRFIIVANFLIYVAIVLSYMILQERETGISIGIGVVALISARILNWQKSRLELKTELMRNAYLLSAFVVFPYACYHLVPHGYVGVAWVGVAVMYYLLNLIVRSPKYRWMAHGTLLLTTGYLVAVATRQYEPVYRIVSFLVLGAVLLAVSMIFARLRRR